MTAIAYELLALWVWTFKLGISPFTNVALDAVLIFIYAVLLGLSILEIKNGKIKIRVLFDKYATKVVFAIIFFVSLVNIRIDCKWNIDTLNNRETKTNINDYINSYKLYKNIFNEIKQNDGGVYRIEEQDRFCQNDSLAYGFNGITFSGSTYSREQYVFMTKLGYSQQHVLISSDTGNTKIARMLLGVKYIVQNPRGFENRNKINVIKEDKALSLGFAVPSSVLDSNNLKGYSSFAFQNNILKNLTGLNDNVFVSHNKNPDMHLKNLIYNGKEYEKELFDEVAKITYDIEIERNEELYMYLIGDDLEGAKILVNGKNLNYSVIGNFNKMIDIGKFNVGDKVTVEINPNRNKISINSLTLCYEKSEVLEKFYDILSKEQVSLKEVSSREYEGSVNLSGNNEYVMFTIPYDEGWSIKVDGKKAEVLKVQEGFMAVKVSAGEHIISMKYTPKGLILGGTISILGIILFVINLKFQRKRIDNKK